MQIREALAHEVPAVVRMGRRAYEVATGKSDFNEEVSTGNWVCFVQSGQGVVLIAAKEDGVPLGMLCGYMTRDIDTGKSVAQMWHWFVEPEAKGYGVHLLNRFEAWAKSKGCKEVGAGCLAQLWTERHKRIYSRLGYELNGMNFRKEI